MNNLIRHKIIEDIKAVAFLHKMKGYKTEAKHRPKKTQPKVQLTHKSTCGDIH